MDSTESNASPTPKNKDGDTRRSLHSQWYLDELKAGRAWIWPVGGNMTCIFLEERFPLTPTRPEAFRNPSTAEVEKVDSTETKQKPE